MKNSRFFKVTRALISVLILSFLLAGSLQLTQGAGDWDIFLPLITTSNTLIERMRFEIEAVLDANESELSVDVVDYNGFTLTIQFLAPEDMGVLVDDVTFENIFSQINVAMNRVLEEEGHPGPHNFDYELFVNGQILAGGLDPQTDTAARSPAGAPIVALSPGHGWAVAGSGWRLDRGYHNGIVEDFINAELVMQLYPLLQAQGYQVYPVREMDKGAGDHVSGHPWWQMGSSEYARDLGFPGSVWGQYFSQGYNRNIVTPPELANAIGADILVSIHNNGGRGTGTETWYDTSNGYGNESRKLANLIQTTLIERLKGLYDPGWESRGVKGSPGGYGEIRRFDGPAVIVELAFMDTLSDNNALQDPAFQAIAMQAINDAIVSYLGGSVDPVKPTQFSGNVSSRLFTDQSGGRINLEVCADNLPGQTVHAQLSRPGKTFSTVSKTASGRCVTFWDLSGSEVPLSGTSYTTRAALNQPPNPGWGVPCYASTGGRGLCDVISTSSSLTNTFTNGSSSPSIDANAVDLQICADNLPGHTVYVQMWRDAAMGYPARTWNVSRYASGTCVSFGDLDGVGGTFENVDYFTVAALEPIGAGEAAQQQTGCYASSGQTRLCDRVSRNVATNTFVNGGSTPGINTDAVTLQVCGDNLAGRMVYVQMWRDAAEGYPTRTWNFSRTASSSCITFNDIDGSGGTFANVDYYTVAALEPLGSTEAAQKRTSCYWDTGETRLCDKVRRTVATNKFVNGGSNLSITTTAVNLQVCGDNLAGRTVYVQMWRDAAEGYPANTWNVSKVAGNTCVTFSDLDGAGNSFANVYYYTVAALEPIGATEAAQKRTACYWDTGETRLCDRVSR